MICKDRRSYQLWRRNHADVPELEVYRFVPVSQGAPKVSSLGIDCARRARSAPPRFEHWDENDHIAALIDTSALAHRSPPSPPSLILGVCDIDYKSPDTILSEPSVLHSFRMYVDSEWVKWKTAAAEFVTCMNRNLHT